MEKQLVTRKKKNSRVWMPRYRATGGCSRPLGQPPIALCRVGTGVGLNVGRASPSVSRRARLEVHSLGSFVIRPTPSV